MQEAQEAVSGADMFANTYDPETTFEGNFEISTRSIGKRCFPCYITTDDGERMICSYEPMEEYRNVGRIGFDEEFQKFKFVPFH